MEHRSDNKSAVTFRNGTKRQYLSMVTKYLSMMVTSLWSQNLIELLQTVECETMLVYPPIWWTKKLMNYEIYPPIWRTKKLMNYEILTKYNKTINKNEISTGSFLKNPVVGSKKCYLM